MIRKIAVVLIVFLTGCVQTSSLQTESSVAESNNNENVIKEDGIRINNGYVEFQKDDKWIRVATEDDLNDLREYVNENLNKTNSTPLPSTTVNNKTVTTVVGPQGPKGDKGETGSKGDKGDKGDPGASGSVVSIAEDGELIINGTKTGYVLSKKEYTVSINYYEDGVLVNPQFLTKSCSLENGKYKLKDKFYLYYPLYNDHYEVLNPEMEFEVKDSDITLNVDVKKVYAIVPETPPIYSTPEPTPVATPEPTPEPTPELPSSLPPLENTEGPNN